MHTLFKQTQPQPETHKSLTPQPPPNRLLVHIQVLCTPLKTGFGALNATLMDTTVVGGERELVDLDRGGRRDSRGSVDRGGRKESLGEVSVESI